MNTQRIWQILASLVLVALAVYFGSSWTFYVTTLASPFFAISLVSVCIFHFSVRRSSLDFLAVLGFTVFLGILDFRVLHYPIRQVAWLSFLGLGSFLMLALRFAWEPRANRKLLALSFAPSFLFVCSDWAAYYFLSWTEKLHPRVFDLNLYVFDASLHIQLPFLIGQWFQQLPVFQTVSSEVYLGLPVIIAVVYTGLLLRNQRRSLAAMLAFLVTGPIGILFYNMLPALGPMHIFQSLFPWHPLSLVQIHKLAVEPIAIAGPRNAIPSLHMAWVLLAWWYSRGLSIWRRALAALFVVFTFFATMGIGEHYFIDLVAAVPFSLFIKSICSFHLSWKNPDRLRPMVAGLSFLGFWFVLLRFAPKVFLLSPIPPWGLVALTVAVCWYLEANQEHVIATELSSEALSAPEAIPTS